MKRSFLTACLITLVAAGAAIFLVPWNKVVANRLGAYLLSRGVTDVTFTVEQVAFHEATLTDVAIGTDNPLLLQSINVQYDPGELINGTLRDLTLDGLDIHILQQDDQWIIAGMNSFPRTANPDKPAPTLSEIVEKLPFSAIRIENSYIRITGNSIQTALPFTATLQKSPDLSLALAIKPSTLTVDASAYELGAADVMLAPDENQDWRGTWIIESVDPGDNFPFPVLSGKGNLSYTGDALLADGTLASADKTHTATFKAAYTFSEGGVRTITISSVAFPFKEGKVSSRNIVIPIGPRQDITINLSVQKVSIDALLGALTGQRVTATGSVSGRVPVILKKDGTYNLGKGTLQADGGGTIQMSAEAIPGNNEQVGLVRDILENLKYTVLSAAVDNTGGQGIVVRLSLEGHNPDVYDGHPVKLNVNLTGDVLDFIQQNAMLITKPETLLKRELE